MKKADKPAKSQPATSAIDAADPGVAPAPADPAAPTPASDEPTVTSTRPKPRILYVAKILAAETDPDHALTLAQLTDRLADLGISAERKALYRDFDALTDAGFPVARTPTRPTGYYLAERLLDAPQMMLLADAVQTSRSITKKNSTAILRRLKRLVSRHEARDLDARIHVAGRVKTQNESVFHTLDVIQRALAERRDLTFGYVRYDASLRPRDVAAEDGRRRVRTPLFLVYVDDNYYMLTYDERAADRLRRYRVDRMRNVMLLERSPRAHRLPAGFDIAEYERQVMGMYGGEPEPIQLLVEEPVVENMVDMFGVENVSSAPTKSPDGQTWAKMRVKAVASPVLFGKLAQFGGKVRVQGPKHVREAYRTHLQECLETADPGMPESA